MYNIPEDKLPKEWKDESSLNYLFSPVRTRTVNPKDWDSKVSSWKNLISLYCVSNGVYSFTLAFLDNLFSRNGRSPRCLGVIIEEMHKGGELQYMEDYLKTAPKTWGGWVTDVLVKKPITWSYTKIKRSLFSTNTSTEQTYVYLTVIRAEAQKLLVSIPENYRNKVITFTDLLKITNQDLSKAQDVKLLLHHLLCEQKVDISHLEKGSDEFECFLVKFGQNKVTPISEVEIGTYVLEKNEKLFSKHVEELEDQISQCVADAKGHILKGHRQLAKTCLRKKHEIEKRLTRKVNALHNVQVLLERIKDVSTDAAVWQSYKHALATFETTFEETGLSEDAVENTMIKLGEVMDVHDEIQAAIARPISGEDEDLEAELEELMKNDEHQPPPNDGSDLDETLSKLDLGSLPNVPTTEISLPEITLG